MTEKAFPRGEFDHTAYYVVNRTFLLSGVAHEAGSLFERHLVPERKLRLLYQQRYLRSAAPHELPENSAEVQYVVNREIVLNGKIYPPGAAFARNLVDTRKLLQLYDQRYLRLADPPQKSLKRVRAKEA